MEGLPIPWIEAKELTETVEGRRAMQVTEIHELEVLLLFM